MDILNKVKAGTKVQFRQGHCPTIHSIQYLSHEDLYLITFVDAETHFVAYHPEGTRNITGRNKTDIVKVFAKSEDLICFTLRLHRAEDPRYMRVLTQAFGLQRRDIPMMNPWDELRYYEEMKIICRPDQFSKFIILRQQNGLSNLVKELQPNYIDFFEKGILCVSVADNQ